MRQSYAVCLVYRIHFDILFILYHTNREVISDAEGEVWRDFFRWDVSRCLVELIGILYCIKRIFRFGRLKMV